MSQRTVIQSSVYCNKHEMTERCEKARPLSKFRHGSHCPIPIFIHCAVCTYHVRFRCTLHRLHVNVDLRSNVDTINRKKIQTISGNDFRRSVLLAFYYYRLCRLFGIYSFKWTIIFHTTCSGSLISNDFY